MDEGRDLTRVTVQPSPPLPPSWPSASRRHGRYIVLLAAAAMVGTLPGRSQGLGLVTEPLLADLEIDRLTWASYNFWATIGGAAGALAVGRLLDRAGPRVALTMVSSLLGLVVCAMSAAAGTVALVATLTLTRLLGQSALSVVSIAMIGRWFTQGLDRAMAAYSILLSIGFMAAFPLVGALVQAWGWRRAWFVVGATLVAGLAPLAWLIARRGPETAAGTPDDDASGYRWGDALTTGAFWVFATGTALYGLVASGIGLFNESILAERGFDADVYYQSLAVTALMGLFGNFAGGCLAERLSLTRLMAVAMAVLALGLAALPHLGSFAAVMTWAAGMGLGGGLVMVLFFSVWPRLYGRRHLGQIQGAAQALTVLASAIGPLLLAWCVEATGSYTAMFRILAGAILAAALAALVVQLPRPAATTALPAKAGAG